MSWLTAFGLCLAGLFAIIVEFFVPAGGIIGILGFGSMVAAVVIAYVKYGTMVGSAFLIGVVVITPIAMAIYFKLFPKSFVGRWLILGKTFSPGKDQNPVDQDPGGQDPMDQGANPEREIASTEQDGGGAESSVPEEKKTTAATAPNRLLVLIGKTGKATSALRPSGTVVIDGRKYSVVTGGEFLDAGSNVVVTRVEGNRIKVRKGASDS